MCTVIALFLSLMRLVVVKVLQVTFAKITFTTVALASSICTRPVFLCCHLFNTMVSFITGTVSFSWHSQGSPAPHQRKVGVAILTRFPVAERAAVRADSPTDALYPSLKNASLFERIMGELAAQCVLNWLDLLAGNKRVSVSPRLFLVYRKTYTSAFSLDGWFNTIPNHTHAKSVYSATVKDSDVGAGLDSKTLKGNRFSELLNMARHNASRRASWEDPDVFCSARARSLNTRSTSFRAPSLMTAGSQTSSLATGGGRYTFTYVTVEGLDFDRLLEVAVHSSLTADSDYVIVVNPRVIGLRPEHLTIALELLMNVGLTEQADRRRGDAALGPCAKNNTFVGSGISEICAVLGLTKPATPSLLLSSSASTLHTGQLSSGLYLIGLRGGRQLLLSANLLTNSVVWSTPSTADRLLANMKRYLTGWNVVCMRERLEELTYAQDLFGLERYLGIPFEHLLDDVITLVIPIGPGHLDDDLDRYADAEQVNANTSKALACSLELAVYNASGRRRIEIIIINSCAAEATSECSSEQVKSMLFSSTDQNAAPDKPVNRADSDGERRFRGTKLRPMVTVSLHHYSGEGDGLPRRGQLIRYAVDRFAKGSMLVFIEAGVQLPPRWDSAVFHTLQRPGVGMGCFAYRLHLDDKYVLRKSFRWAINSMAANYLIDLQMHWFGIPIAGQPYFIYAHYLACLGGYPQSSRWLHAIDLALACRRSLGSVAVSRFRTAAAGVPASFALRHGAYRTAIYTSLVSVARCFGASEGDLAWAIGRPQVSVDARRTDLSSPTAHSLVDGVGKQKGYGLPLIQPHYLDGY